MCCTPEEIVKVPDYLDIIFKSATITIAAVNVIFAVKFFNFKNKKDDSDKEKDRKIQLLKTLVLDHNLKSFYELFDQIEVELVKLKQANLTDIQKSEIESALEDLFIALRRKFYDSLLAIDGLLYDGIKSKVDAFQEHLSNVIFDAGINLSHAPKYGELIDEKLTSTKTDIIKKLFSYRG